MFRNLENTLALYKFKTINRNTVKWPALFRDSDNIQEIVWERKGIE